MAMQACTFVLCPVACAGKSSSTPNKSPKRRRKPAGFWADIENIRAEIVTFNADSPAVADASAMPTARLLRANGRRDLDNAISKMGGYTFVAAKLGLQSSHKAIGYWDDFSNLEKEVLSFLKKADSGVEGTFPTLKELRTAHRSDIAEAIKRHGGVAHVADRLGLLPRSQKRPAGYWKEWERVEAALVDFMAASGGAGDGSLPSQGELRQAGRSDLSEAITDYHGGFRAVAARLGVPSKKKESFFYSKFYNLAGELYSLVHAHGTQGVMPTVSDLQSLRRSDLVSAIRRHGGMASVSQRLGLTYKVRAREAFRDWRVFRRRLLAFIELNPPAGGAGSLDELPSSRTLENFGRMDLYVGVLHHGGPRVVADRLGLRRGYLQDFHVVGEQILAFIRTHGTEGVFPTEADFLEVGRGALNVAVAKFGYSQVAKRLGLQAPAQSTEVALNAFTTKAIADLEADECECETDDLLGVDGDKLL